MKMLIFGYNKTKETKNNFVSTKYAKPCSYHEIIYLVISEKTCWFPVKV